jgi:tetratricopeptide (TPR) repeat protein
VDVSLEQVRFRGQIFDGRQWVEFYARLALDLLETSDNPRWLTPESLQRLASWSVKSLGSVGKEVARHLGTLKRSSVESKGITKAWRLTLNPDVLSLLPNQAATEAWLRARTIDPSTRLADDTVAHLIDGLMALRGGHTERADADLRAVGGSPLPPAFAALNALLRFKVDVQYAELEDLEREAEAMAAATDPLSLSVHARLVASLAFLNRFQSSGRHTKALERAAAKLEGTGDLATLGTVLNVLGLLCRRAGEPIRATGYLQHALALSAISQDYVTVQGTLFNLAQARIAAREAEGLPPDESAFILIDLCLRVCLEFGVGSDSVQAELLATSCARKLGQYERAKRHLADSEQFVKQLENPYEVACWHRQRAKLAVDANDPLLDPLKDARIAAKFFAEAGAIQEADEMSRLEETLRRN